MKIFVKILPPFLLFTCMVVYSGSTIKAENVKWKYYATGGDYTKHYYDPQSIVFTSAHVGRVWEKVIVSETSAYLTKEIRALREIDCFRKVYRTLEMHIEYRDGSEQEKSYPDPKWLDITPNSWLETLYEIVCSKNKSR
ncbi:MAG: surface-adhesin E family protein [Candidatus Loosdrechtia sp.]|uniref:surface-adhesin E family protein n=1 Tax=Candidatus Loosdrechtia sp. TaxID=3101272 RepID=UPI003A721B8C|nr:MAG: hypothetical protein QY305_07610 [Candidatus Jettenia sp. AMX2]